MSVDTCNPSIELVSFFKGLFVVITTTIILKNTIKAHPRPDYPLTNIKDVYTFPSGHSSVITYIAAYIWLSNPCLITFILMYLLWYNIAYKRYIDRYHRLSEVIAGSVLGFLVAYYSVKRTRIDPHRPTETRGL